jgi:hypothetical protein
MSKLEESLRTLTEALESTNTVVGPALDMTWQLDNASPFLNKEAKDALVPRSYNTVDRDADGRFYECLYLCVQTRSDKVTDGVKAIASDLNELASRGLIYSALQPLGSIELARIPLKTRSSIVYSFVLVPSDRLDEAKSLVDWAVPEGGSGEPLMSLDPELQEGEFLAAMQVSFLSGRLQDTPENLVQAEIKEYLNVLPPGTEVVEVVKCAVGQLYIAFEVRFRNPLMKRFKQVKLIRVRHAEIVGDKIEHFDLLTGVEYIFNGEVHR